MRLLARCAAFSLMVGVALAQDVPKADLFLGYSFLRANSARDIPAFTNNGGLGTLAWNFTNHVAAEFEFGGYHNGNINNIQFDTTEMTYLFGPRFSLGRSRKVNPYIHTLFGGVHLTTSLPVTLAPTPLDTAGTTTRIGASQDAFAMALGGGLDIKLNHYVTFRPIQLDYLMTRLEDFGQSGQPSANRNQHNLRYAAGILFTFGGERPSPPPPPPAPPRTKTCSGGTTVPIEQECPKQNITLGVLATPSQICQGATASVTPNASLPEGAVIQWMINGETTSQAQLLEFGSTGRNPGTYRIGLKVTAEGYNDALAETAITVLGYVPPSGTLRVSPSEIWLGEKATLSASFMPGQCGGALGRVTFSAPEGSVSGDQFEAIAVQFAPPGTSEQQKTITITAKVSDEKGSGSAQANVVVKQRALISARQLPDVLFAKNSDRVNNCGKRVLLEELRTLENNDPAGKVVLVGHIAEGEQASKDLDLKRALNAAAVISAGREACTAFPTSQIFVTAAGAADNGVPFQPNFCGGSTAAAEKPGQAVAANDDTAKYRRTEVWFVPNGGAVPASGASAQDAATLGVNRLGCPR
ncbi:MAG TPA: hypothetical protein VGQ49_01055 [Bryobacteraceae bacterium]|jgi:hypothetical protein|nr:hypothetical protein [Bryobacteraceae bacterium]